MGNLAKDFTQKLLDGQETADYQIEVARDSISDKICALMQEQGVTKAEMARRLGKSPAYVTKVLQGNTNFTVESLVKIGLALGLVIDVGRLFIPKEQSDHWFFPLVERVKDPVVFNASTTNA